MNGTKIAIGKRPNYFHGQLLQEDDFLEEQKYHSEAQQRHNLNAHDWGVVRGLAVTPAHERSVRISPGAAVDPVGRDLLIDDTSVVELNGFQPHDRVSVCLEYEEAPVTVEAKRVDCYAVVSLAKDGAARGKLILATVVLDDRGRVSVDSIDYSQTKYARLAAKSITADQLHDDLRRGWLRMPFRPSPMVDIPEGEKELPPRFRVGATRTLTPDHEEANMKDRGAGGTMAIPIPPLANHVTRFRIAGSTNEGEIHLRLYTGGWNKEKNEHHRKILVEERIVSQKSGAKNDTPFFETFEIKETKIDPELWTLGVWLRCTKRTSISLIAVEFAY